MFANKTWYIPNYLVTLQANNINDMKEQQVLFDFPKLRRSNGRFCTPEQLHVERIDNENKRLRLERDKYFRMYVAIEKDNERLIRELTVLKSKIQDLL